MITVPPTPAFISHKPKPARTAAPVNVNLLDVFLLNSGALLLEFDGPVTVNPIDPPTTWTFNVFTSIQPAAINYGQSG